MRTLKQLQDLTNKWALVTGGAGHIALAAAQSLLEQGAQVILLDRDLEGLTLAKSKLEEFSDQVHLITCELSSEQAIRQAIEQATEITRGRLNILINNAAFVGTDKLIGWCVPFEQQSFDTFKQCVDVNLSAPFLLCQLCLPLISNHEDMVKSIINISSIYSVVGPQMDMYEGTKMGNPAAYAASKAGLMQLTTWLSSTLAPTIRANNIVLGGVYRGQEQEFLTKYCAKVPLNRMATEEDIKGAIAYLGSELSNYMTGQSIFLDGGWTAI